jgi:hypothetical protein
MPPDHPLLLDVAPEVVRALGAASVLRLRADPTLDEYVCCVCDQPAHARSPDGGSVVVVRYTDGVILARLAHPDCSPSVLITVLGGPPLRAHTIRARSELTAGGHPVLQLLNDLRAWRRADTREAIDHYVRAHVAGGFTPLNSDAGVATAPVAQGLSVTLDQGSRVRLASPAGTLFDGVVDSSDEWRRAVRRRRRLTVVACTPGRAENPTLAATAQLARAPRHPAPFL